MQMAQFIDLKQMHEQIREARLNTILGAGTITCMSTNNIESVFNKNVSQALNYSEIYHFSPK